MAEDELKEGLKVNNRKVNKLTRMIITVERGITKKKPIAIVIIYKTTCILSQIRIAAPHKRLQENKGPQARYAESRGHTKRM